MELPADRVPVPASPIIPIAPVAAAPEGLDRAREINSRRSEIENPELLRRLRSL